MYNTTTYSSTASYTVWVNGRKCYLTVLNDLSVRAIDLEDGTTREGPITVVEYVVQSN